jgi:hypothetical protein
MPGSDPAAVRAERRGPVDTPLPSAPRTSMRLLERHRPGVTEPEHDAPWTRPTLDAYASEESDGDFDFDLDLDDDEDEDEDEDEDDDDDDDEDEDDDDLDEDDDEDEEDDDD